MKRNTSRLHKLLMAAFFVLAVFYFSSRATASAPGDTIVRFDTTLGDFDVELFNSATPASVANFLNYVTSGRYVDSIVHRSVPGFVIQGGGYAFSDSVQNAFAPPFEHVVPVLASPPIVNEHGLHNVRGTIAMATAPGQPNSATDQWFINLADNSANLDFQNGGFAVFGQVLGSGMNVVDAIAGKQRVDGGLPFSELPIISFPAGSVAKKNLILVNDIRVVPEPASANLLGIAALCIPLGKLHRIRQLR